VYVQKYFKIDDPREGAALLLQEAALAQVDIDRVYEGGYHGTVIVGAGSVTPHVKDMSFVERASTMTAAGEPDTKIAPALGRARLTSDGWRVKLRIQTAAAPPAGSRPFRANPPQQPGLSNALPPSKGKT
jgi:hypothetical protein